MFTQLNNDGQLGIRFFKEVPAKNMGELGQVIPILAVYLNEINDYVMPLEPIKTTK